MLWNVSQDNFIWIWDQSIRERDTQLSKFVGPGEPLRHPRSFIYCVIHSFRNTILFSAATIHRASIQDGNESENHLCCTLVQQF